MVKMEWIENRKGVMSKLGVSEGVIFLGCAPTDERLERKQSKEYEWFRRG